ncbi:MAG: hypothetical protein V1886_00035 [archaeon]
MKYLLRKLLSDKSVEKNYLHSGALFGGDVSYLHMGECLGFKSHLSNLSRWEQEYAKRGFKTVSIDDFIELGGHGKSISSLLGVKRKPDEKIILHAELYRQHYLGKIKPAIDLGRMMKDGKQQFGTYSNPSTKIFEEK